jgi:membrane-bound lytic murein transglycosylase D
MKRLLIFLSALSTAMMSSFSGTVSAQILNDQPVIQEYDPIAATLDSLVNLVYVQRLSQLNTPPNTQFKPYEVPSYSADVYRSRIAKIQTPIPLTYNNQVREYIDMYALKKRGLTERVMGLSNLYFPLYEEILDQQGLPVEFKYLSIVESALNPTAVSRVGATGLWQFMHATGRLYNLKINSYIDERRDPVKSTVAACQYFKDMYAIYNDWLLVIAAYNCGAGNVNKAIARSGGKKTFWEICSYLPRETRGYVPAFIAVTYLLNYSAEHNLTPVPPVMSYFDADTIMVHQQVSLKHIADAVNMTPELVSYLNPIYKRGVIPDSDEPMALRLPSSKISSYLANIQNIYQPEIENKVILASMDTDVGDKSSYTTSKVRKTHSVRKGEHLQAIAKKYNCTVSDLKNWNRIKGTRLAVGQKLTVYVKQKTKTDKIVSTRPAVKQTLAKNSKPSQKKSGDGSFVYHTVEEGDTLWEIAKAYDGVTVEQIKSINRLRSENLKVGTVLKVKVTG